MSILKNNVVVGITAGLVATMIAPFVMSVAKKFSRPLAKSLIKGGIVAYEKGRETVAGTGEMMEDMMAEVRAEMMEKNFATASAGTNMHHHDDEVPHAGNGNAQHNGSHTHSSSTPQERTVQ